MVFFMYIFNVSCVCAPVLAAVLLVIPPPLSLSLSLSERLLFLSSSYSLPANLLHNPRISYCISNIGVWHLSLEKITLPLSVTCLYFLSAANLVFLTLNPTTNQPNPNPTTTNVKASRGLDKPRQTCDRDHFATYILRAQPNGNHEIRLGVRFYTPNPFSFLFHNSFPSLARIENTTKLNVLCDLCLVLVKTSA